MGCRERWMRHATLAVALSGLALTPGLTACNSTGDGEGSPAAPVPSRRSAVVAVPQPSSGLTVVYRSSVLSGDSGLVTMTVRAARAWVDVNCQGAGSLVVSLSPGGRFDVPCPAEGVNSSRNQVYVERSGVMVLRVSAPGIVNWAITVAQ